MFRKGQLSTYLKPVTVLLMTVLLVVVLFVALQFGANIKTTRASYELQSQASKIKDDIVRCLSVNTNYTKSEIVINRSKLSDLQDTSNYMEPDCAEDFQYGWNASVKLEYLPGVARIISEEDASIILILDISGSMAWTGDSGQPKIEEVKQGAINFIDQVSGGVKVGIITFNGATNLVQSLTTDKTLLKQKIRTISNPNGGTCLGCGITRALDELKRNGKGNLYGILLTDGCPCPDVTYPAAIQKAQQMGVKIHTIGFSLKDTISGRCTCRVTDAITHLDRIASETGGKRFLAKDLTTLKEVYQEISTQIEKGYAQYGLSETTCSLEPLMGYRGKIDLAFIIDRSDSMNKPVICDYIENIVSGLREVGIKVNYTVYGMPDQPMTTPDAAIKYFAVRSMWDPSCMDKKANWTDSFSFHLWRDGKPEGWGPSTSWVLDDYDWQEDSEKVIVIFGDQDPTGGCDGDYYESHSATSFSTNSNFKVENVAKLCTNCMDRHGDTYPLEYWNPWKGYPGKDNATQIPMDSEVEIMSNISSKANEKGVEITFLRALEYQLKKQYKFGSPTVNDAIEAMENVSSETGGSVYFYTMWDSFLSDLKEKFFYYQLRDSVETCPNVLYTFGEKEGSFGRSLDEETTLSFPVSVLQNKNLIVPGTLTVQVRDGDLERIVSKINKVYSIGNSKQESYSSVLELNLDNSIEIKDAVLKKPKKVEYTLSGGLSETDPLIVDEDLRVGLYGEDIFQDQDGLPTTAANANYTGEPIKFYARQNAALQILAMNYERPTLEISPLYLHCCGDQTQKIGDGVFEDADIDLDAYNNASIGYTFFYSFPTIKIGETEEYSHRSVCMISSTQENCVELKMPSINLIKLQPGQHFLKIKYIHPGVMEVTE